MTQKKIYVKKNFYMDSVFLMDIAEKVKNMDGVKRAIVQMATDGNREFLKDSGFEAREATSNDLVIAFELEEKFGEEKILGSIKELLEDQMSGSKSEYETEKINTIEDALSIRPKANLCLISVPGGYVENVAKKAIEKGLNLFIFSGDVPIKVESELKELGREKGLLVMGPDCGVGVLDGIAIATGSAVNRGKIGIIAASGSGAQEISCIIEKLGSGISQLIGTGGRDLSQDINGMMMIESIKRLDRDEDTKVIVLVSKIASEIVMEKVLNEAGDMNKPVVTVFLGVEDKIFKNYAKNIYLVNTLEEAAKKAVSLERSENIKIITNKELDGIAESEANKLSSKQRYLRGIYCGGTFCEEALIVLSALGIGNLYSNINSKFGEKLIDKNISKKNTLVDMGSEEFTEINPHPVFNNAMRVERFKEETSNKDVAVIMLDFIMGFGVNRKPLEGFIKPIEKAKISAQENGRYLSIIASICGSKNDPQDIVELGEKLSELGVIVADSNAQAAMIAGKIIKMV